MQSLRMSKSHLIKKLKKKIKEKLLSEQTIEPVDVLFIVYKKSTNRYKKEGS